jgi:hypothetical protein
LNVLTSPGTGAALQEAWRRLHAYAGHDDANVAGCNLIALIVASNQPFYPLYVHWLVSPHVTPTLLTFLSTPFFLAVPAVSRRWPTFGRALLPLTGMSNVMVSAKAFGAASGVEIFLMPCALIAAAFFGPNERGIGLALLAAALGTFLIRGHYGTPMYAYSAEELAAFVRLNAVSAGMLVAFVGFVLSSRFRD